MWRMTNSPDSFVMPATVKGVRMGSSNETTHLTPLPTATSPYTPIALVFATAAMAALAVAMGIGRFAFTPVLPMMLSDGSVTLAAGSWLATANYAGYLVGALLAMGTRHSAHARRRCCWRRCSPASGPASSWPRPGSATPSYWSRLVGVNEAHRLEGRAMLASPSASVTSAERAARRPGTHPSPNVDRVALKILLRRV